MEDKRMNGEVDCQVFQDQLDALVKGTLPEEAHRYLLIHAEGCPECAMQLRVQEHLTGPSLEELEARVPDILAAGMWGRVKESVEEEGGGRPSDVGAGTSGDGAGASGAGARGSRAGGFGWLVPTLTAASLLLLFATGFLSLELSRLREREAGLAQQVEEQQRWLAELELGPSADPVARTAALAGRNPWLRALSRQETITVDDLRALLERMPVDRTVMTRVQLDAALRSRFPLSASFLSDVLARVEEDGPRRGDGGGGVRAGDLLRVLNGLNVSPELSVPTSELMDLLS